MSLLKTDKISYTYPQMSSIHHAAISNVSFSVNSGETVGIIGHTGSGKSTLLQTLNGLIKPDCGTVFLDEADLWEDKKTLSKKRFRVGLVFQYPEHQLFEETVYKDIAFGPTNMGLEQSEIERRVLSYANLLGLKSEHLEKSPFDLSGGEKRRAALAGVLSMEPDVLVLDEPTAGLDPLGRRMLFSAIDTYQKQSNAGVIIVSHSMEDLANLCDKLLVMCDGEVKLFDNTQNVFSQTELLQEIGLDVPLVTRVLLELKKLGVNVDTRAFNVDDAVNAILKVRERGGDHA